MKSQGVTVPLKAYTCLFDACSKCHDKEEGLRLTKYLHEEITTRAVPLNGVHYHAMAKGKHRLTKYLQITKISFKYHQIV